MTQEPTEYQRHAKGIATMNSGVTGHERRDVTYPGHGWQTLPGLLSKHELKMQDRYS